MMFLKVNGVELEGFTSATVRKALGELSGEFSFTTTATETSNFPIQRMAEVEIFAENVKVMEGFVDVIDVNYSDGSHSINIKGRDKTSILIDSSIPGSRTFNGPINIQKIMQQILLQLGSNLTVINEVPDLRVFKSNLVAEVSETAFSFIEKYARMSNVVLTSTPDGEILITRAGTTPIETILLNQIGNEENNILSGSVVFDDSKRFSKYIVLSQGANNDEISNEVQVNIRGESQDDGALKSKQKVLLLESEGTIDLAKQRADWEANIRRTRAVRASYEVQGFFHASGIWEPNSIVHVVDVYSTIDSDMLIDSVEYTYNEGDGSKTNISLLPPDAYTLAPEPITKTKTESVLGWTD